MSYPYIFSLKTAENVTAPLALINHGRPWASDWLKGSLLPQFKERHERFETMADNKTLAASKLTPLLPVPPLPTAAYTTKRTPVLYSLLVKENHINAQVFFFFEIVCRRERGRDQQDGSRCDVCVHSLSHSCPLLLPSQKLPPPALTKFTTKLKILFYKTCPL